MTDYNALAQRIVAQGIGQFDPHTRLLPYLAPEAASWDDAAGFCQDGRVVLALMEKVVGSFVPETDEAGTQYGTFLREITITPARNTKEFCVFVTDWPENKPDSKAIMVARCSDSLAIAIVEACLDALENSND